MASKDLAITDVFPMRKRRALGTTKQSRHDTENARGAQPMPESCLLETPITKTSSSKKNPRNSPLGRNDKQLPVQTPTRPNVSPSAVLGRLRKTPQRLAAWRSQSLCDSGPEIIWDNDCLSPTSTLDSGTRNGCNSKAPMQGQLASIIRKISKDCKSLSKVEANLFDSWMKKDDGESGYSSELADRHCKKKKSVVHRASCQENPKLRMPRIARKWSRTISNNAIKIKEELSNFMKDINERENLNAANSEEERMGKETEKSDQLGTQSKNLLLENVDLDLIDDNDWLDLEDLPAELKEFGTSESGVMGRGKDPKGDLRGEMTEDYKAQVEASLLTCTTASVFPSAECNADKKDSELGNDADCYIRKNMQRGVIKENDCIHKEVTLHRHKDREGKKLFEDNSKVASSLSLKHQKDKESTNTFCEQEKQRLFLTKLKQTYDIGAKTVAATSCKKQSMNLPPEIGKSLKHHIADFVKGVEQPCAEKMLVPIVKRELLTASGEEENEFNKLINSEGKYVFDELEEDTDADKFNSIDGVVEECNLSDFECGDFEDDLLLVEENENQSENAENRERAKPSCEFTVDKEKDKMPKGNVLNSDDWFEVETDLNEINFDDNGDLLYDSQVNGSEILHRSKAGLGKNSRVENKGNRKGSFVECEHDMINVPSSIMNCNMQYGGNGRENRSKITFTCAAVTNIEHEVMDAGLNIGKEEGDLIATKGCKDFEGNAKPTEVAKFEKANESLVDSYLKKHYSSLPGSTKDDNGEFNAKKCILSNDSLIDIDLGMADWDDEISLQGDQFANEQKCGGKSINDGKIAVTQLMGELKNSSKKLLRETELSDDAQVLSKQSRHVTSDVPKFQKSKSRKNKFNFKPIRSLPKEISIPAGSDLITGHNSAQICDIMQRAKVEVECKHNSGAFFEPELSLIANEATGKCDRIDYGSYWDEGLSPFNQCSAPVTSTQKTEKFFYRKQSQTGKKKMCTAEEIEKKRAEAMKKLEQRKFKEKQRK